MFPFGKTDGKITLKYSVDACDWASACKFGKGH